jgi:putative hydrolase of the HAD superfamily
MVDRRAVIFDLYGVLGLNGWQAFKTRHFAHRPEDWTGLAELGQQVDAGKENYDTLIGAIAETTGESRDTVRFQLEHTLPNLELLEYIRSELKPAYKIGLLSNARSDVLADIFTDDQLALFDVTVLSAHVGLTKPDPAMFAYIFRSLGVAPEDCVYVDDQERHVEAAESLGAKGVLFESVAQTKHAVARELVV